MARKTLANMVALVKVKTLVHKLANVEAKALVNKLASTLREKRCRHLARHTIVDTPFETPQETLT